MPVRFGGIGGGDRFLKKNLLFSFLTCNIAPLFKGKGAFLKNPSNDSVSSVFYPESFREARVKW
jgi:hypothetical protein